MSKRMTALKAKIEEGKAYPIEEAVKLVQETSNVKFDASVEVHLRLGVDPKQSDQQIRGTVVLPHGSGQTKKIAAFVAPDKEKEAKEAGADLVCGEEEIKKIKDTGKIDFDIAVTTPDMMPKLASVARVLGPRGLMPNAKTETVGTDLKKMVGEMKKGKISFKNDDTSNVHQIIGKVSFSAEQLLANFEALLEALKKARPASVKGSYIKNVTLTSSMGPGIKVAV